jgi:tetratricopeptide (TPR) repeat protein
LGWIVKDLADAALRAGDVDRALELIEESIEILEPTGWHEGLAAALTEVGRALVAEGRVEEAIVHHRRALRTAADLGQPYAIADAVEGIAETVARSGDEQLAVELLGSAAVVRGRMGVPKHSLQYVRSLDALTTTLRHSLGAGRYEEAFARGECRAPTEVVALFDTAEPAMTEV